MDEKKIEEVMALVDSYQSALVGIVKACTPYELNNAHRMASAARLAIESKLRELVQVPPGYALVPVEPTKAMIEAAEEAYMPFGAMELAYAAMLSAAPKVGH